MTKQAARWVLLGVGAAALGLGLAGCWPWTTADTFTIAVTPGEIADLAQNADGIFLLTIEETGSHGSTAPFTLTVDGSDGMVLVPSEVDSGKVAEVWLNVMGVDVGTTVTLTFSVERDEELHTATVTALVTEPVEAPDDRLETGTAMRDLFVPWLASEHPELGIDEDTEWIANPLRPHILEVSYYMFLSDEWELVVWWHVMIPPYDWARMYVRHIGTENAPSFGAEISSISAGDEPHTMTPPEELWR
ncbi:MAG: hypothetical protein PHU43_02775 [Candidatus Bipolaricaulis sp.]|nr:hypothetical protein [Candidatus Bipolaricaulis sp.]